MLGSNTINALVTEANVYENRCYQKFRNIHRETHVLESLFIKVAGLLKMRLQIRASL